MDLLSAMAEKMGSKIDPDQIRLTSWTEAYRAALNDNNAVLFSTFRLADREGLFKWVGPINNDSDVLFARWDASVAIGTASDLNNYTIGVLADDATVPELLAAGVDGGRLVFGANSSELIEMLENGEIDLWCYPELVGRSLAEEVTGDYYAFRTAYQLESNAYYYAFNRNVSDQVVNAFQKALDDLKDGSGKEYSDYELIIGRYIPSIGLGQLDYLAEDFAPFNYLEDGEARGLSVEILERVFERLGVDKTGSDVGIVPLAEALERARGNTGTVVLSIVRTGEREALYKWAGPFTSANIVLFANLSRGITISSDADLNDHTIGVVESSFENDLLAGRGVDASNIVNAATPAELLQMLLDGDIDLWATGELAGQAEINKAGVDPDMYGIEHLLDQHEAYFIFSKDVPDRLVDAFQNIIDLIRLQPDATGVTDYDRIIYKYLGVGYAQQTFTDAEAMELVNLTAAAIGANAAETFAHINAGDAPYVDPDDHSLYVFVYDLNVTMMAHGENPLLVGSDLSGKTDVTGRAFRDELVAGALANGTGWVGYVYISPTKTNLFYKITYYCLVLGSDGNQYVVCCGNYRGYA